MYLKKLKECQDKICTNQLFAEIIFISDRIILSSSLRLIGWADKAAAHEWCL